MVQISECVCVCIGNLNRYIVKEHLIRLFVLEIFEPFLSETTFQNKKEGVCSGTFVIVLLLIVLPSTRLKKIVKSCLSVSSELVIFRN